MPFNTTSCTLLFHAQRHLPKDASVLEFCFFSLEISDDLLKWLIQKASSFPQIQTQALEKLLSLDYESRKQHPVLFHQALGFQSPVFLDSHSKHDCQIADFNLDFKKHYHFEEQHDLIINNGTTEHVFDQRMIFENMHNLCKKGGFFLHKIPMYNVLNIALYGISPFFYFDLALANHYKIVDFRIANRWGDTVPVHLKEAPIDFTNEFYAKLPRYPGYVHGVGLGGEKANETFDSSRLPQEMELPKSLLLEEILKKSPLDLSSSRLSQACNTLAKRARQFRPHNGGEIYATAILQKTSDAPFQIPYQGNCLKDIEPDDFRKRYQNQIDARNKMNLS